MEELIISADSHVIEVPDLWEKGMPQALSGARAQSLFRRKERRLDVRLGGGDPASRRWLVHGRAAAGQSGKFPQGRILCSASGRLGPHRAHEGHGNGRCLRRSFISEFRTGPLLRSRRDPPGSAVSNLQRLADRLLPESAGSSIRHRAHFHVRRRSRHRRNRALQKSRNGRNHDLASAQTRSCLSLRSITSASGRRLKIWTCRSTSISLPGSAPA